MCSSEPPIGAYTHHVTMMHEQFRNRCRQLAMGLVLVLLAAAPTEPQNVPAYRQADHVAVIVIEGVIDSMTVQSVRRRMHEAIDNGADAIVLRINTPGGELLSTLELCRMLKVEAPANTTAWIDPHAFSAGTIIALACRNIVIAPGGMFGDSAPISPLGPIPQAERAKLESPILTEVIDSARLNHRDERLVQAFVSVGIELWLLQHSETGQRICVDAPEYEAIFGAPPPQTIPSITPGETLNGNDSEPMTPFFDELLAGSLNEPGEDLASMLQRPSSRLRLGPDDRDEWFLVRQIISNDRLLALTPSEGVAYGLIDGGVSSEDELRAFLGARTVTTSRRSWSEQLTSFLVSWPVRLVLIVIFLVCTFIEMAAPGTGLFGAGAAAALLVLLVAPWLVGLAQWWDIMLVLVGLALIAAELLIFPGTIIVGAVGACCLLAGLIGTFVSGDMTSTEAWDDIFRGMLIVFTAIIASVIIIGVLASRFQGSRFANRFVLRSNVGSLHGDGAISGPPTNGVALPLGTRGVAITDLRPAGRVQCGDTILDAVSSGHWIERNSAITIVGIGMTIQVEKIEA
jgi:membrane-bound serine protease (ClpP class)